jgi:hypothetical protein
MKNHCTFAHIGVDLHFCRNLEFMYTPKLLYEPRQDNECMVGVPPAGRQGCSPLHYFFLHHSLEMSATFWRDFLVARAACKKFSHGLVLRYL